MTQELFKPEHIIWALRESMGVVSEAARLLGCSLGTLQVYRERYPEVSDEFKYLKRRSGDWVVGKLLEHIESGNVASTIFYLKTQEGWSEHRTLNIHRHVQIEGEVKFTIEEKAAKFLEFEEQLKLMGGEVIEGEIVEKDFNDLSD